MAELERYGNELGIVGVLVGDAEECELIIFPDTMTNTDKMSVISPTHEEITAIVNQMDTLQITGLNKVVLRKSQRQIDLKVSWAVFKRDGYKCRYCGNDHTPLTVDHIVLWEHMGDSVPDNLITACRNCNKTRGSKPYFDWLRSDYYTRVSVNLSEKEKEKNIDAGRVANTVPIRKHQRSR